MVGDEGWQERCTRSEALAAGMRVGVLARGYIAGDLRIAGQFDSPGNEYGIQRKHEPTRDSLEKGRNI